MPAEHIGTNHTVEFDGDSAHGETYYVFWGENRMGPPTLAFGRDVDRFERRNGGSRIAHRVCVNEKSGLFMDNRMTQEAEAMLYKSGPSRRDKGDISYLRPLARRTDEA